MLQRGSGCEGPCSTLGRSTDRGGGFLPYGHLKKKTIASLKPGDVGSSYGGADISDLTANQN